MQYFTFWENVSKEFDIHKFLRLVVIIGGYIFFRQRYLEFMKHYQVKKQLEEDHKRNAEALVEKPNISEAESTGVAGSDKRWGWGKRTRSKVKAQQKLLQKQLEQAAVEASQTSGPDSDEEINELLED
ncbi:hypothetical protein KL930_002388 [Ogataea haglerorum]|uniref:Processing of GAS1 and ALP protein 2 n=1 Tax=Ogataea haglerorum TaxID=1937702 RepID=A0AAN6D1B5_9ASCO|nr:uncharacterized protein KL911_000006 [Ogataea haglerorum]KAG7691321.1 hypothetical protein KL915_005372 [Ogataea haglerorum]KAG7691535.1 hypothetical protein KL951_005372 [Ogataea haglerorum]KAG7709867.1 hypothetical protein KL914_000777 [Ogataea haglerorum]KAG7711353.1 hypothetical protein KL950_001319 [Ogataea haglerorum]KAG7712929.1 hypothetical protein KL949_005390 [Ogataea haglerorum]